MIERLRRLYKIAVSQYGMRKGWNIVRDGEIVGRLEDPEFADMFWGSYRVKASGDEVLDSGFWDRGVFDFVSIELGEVAPHAFGVWKGKPCDGGRIFMRGLYIQPKTNARRGLSGCWSVFYRSGKIRIKKWINRFRPL
ncbi:hypothetical protein FUAX_54050 (plasmid) [Fulvitalea axinellae]|uniref:Uncharacterized protein n=1 Tax=Fulvitalea axinellae TaxID=1182444 RepID=A0AAU9CS82_9BACT|nr:hypothetical protein FUAX_54050 [Fulvitalea axinellae]